MPAAVRGGYPEANQNLRRKKSHNMAINSHVQIPAQILKNFRDESDPEKKVWYLDISSGRIYKTAASKLGTSKGYYSMAGEDFWSRSLESPLGTLNKKIRTFCESGTERIIVASEDIDLGEL